VSYNFYPLAIEVEQRRQWLQSNLALTLLCTLQPFAIPLEICQLIAEYCSLRKHTIATAKTFWQEDLSMPDHEFNISNELWARRVKLKGVQYIAGLTNKTTYQPTSLIHAPSLGKEVNSLYMAEDHSGLQELFFISSPEIPVVKYRPNLW